MRQEWYKRESDTKTMNLSKSLYTRGIQCPKSLWLKKYRPEVLTPPDASAQAVFETGNEVGRLACELFPGGKEVAYTKKYAQMIETTQSYLAQKLPYIYEATFSNAGILVMVDVLQVDDEGVHIYEVKSSTSLKDIYLHDVSIQYYVLSALGYNVKSASVVYINKEYVRSGKLDLESFFVTEDVSSEVAALQEDIPSVLEKFSNYLSDRENEPDIEIGSHCKNPYPCDALHYCWRVQRQIPKYSIFNVFNLGSKKQMALYEQGIVRIEEIPEDFAMTAKQAAAVANYKAKQTFIDKEKVGQFLQHLRYPIYYLDFETYQQAIPQFEGTKPFEQLPFQYSLHIEHAGGELEHREFLAKEGVDDRYALAVSLCQDIPPAATVLTYNMSFEKGVIARLAAAFPDLAPHLNAINANMHDLMTPFQKKWYVSPQMQGSYSIKYVLPALVPEFEKAYSQLEGVHSGAEAMNAFAKLAALKPSERQKMRKSLLAYCRLDTLAMVKIVAKLQDVIR